MKTVVYSRDALKALLKHGNVAARIRKAVSEFAADGQAHANNVTDLVGTDGRRMRIGNFRVLFEETETTIFVNRIAPRGEAYD